MLVYKQWNHVFLASMLRIHRNPVCLRWAASRWRGRIGECMADSLYILYFERNKSRDRVLHKSINEINPSCTDLTLRPHSFLSQESPMLECSANLRPEICKLA